MMFSMVWSRERGYHCVVVFNLETAVGRARVGVWQARWQGVTTPQANACKEEQRRQRACQTLNRVRSALTQQVRNFKAKKSMSTGTSR